jgi:hypothetical protein
VSLLDLYVDIMVDIVQLDDGVSLTMQGEIRMLSYTFRFPLAFGLPLEWCRPGLLIRLFYRHLMPTIVPSTSVSAWDAILFNNSTARERHSRAVTEWRKTRATHVDLLVGNYLSHYFAALADAIKDGSKQFRRPRRTEGMRFYESCLPGRIGLSPWEPSYPRVHPVGKWDWFVFENSTNLFWESMRPIARHVLDSTFNTCGLRAEVRAPVLHFRCASAPLNHHSQYHFQRYSFYRAAARRYRRRFGSPLRQLHVLTCVSDEYHAAEQAKVCTAHLDDLVDFLVTQLHLEVKVHNCAHSMFEDLAIMYAAPFLISTGSTMSLLPGLVKHVPAHTFVSPRLFDEEAAASNSRAPGRRVGCDACHAWMLRHDHALCQCEVSDYRRVRQVTALLREAIPPGARSADGLCARCKTIRCDTFRPIACVIGKPVDSGATPGTGRAAAVRAASCAAAGAALMSASECKLASAVKGRKWLGSGHNPKEAAGCLLWEDGNIEFNRYTPPVARQLCSIRGTCLCRAPTPSGSAQVIQVIGSPL